MTLRIFCAFRLQARRARSDAPYHDRLAKLLSIFLATLFSITAPAVQFNRVFSPQGGLVSEYEKPARDELCLNGTWLFQGDENTEVPGEQPASPQNWDTVSIKIPSPWNVNTRSK